MIACTSFLTVLPPRSYYSGWSIHGHSIIDSLDRLGYSTIRICCDPRENKRLSFSNGGTISPICFLVDVFLYLHVIIKYKPTYILVFLESHSIALFILSFLTKVRYVHFSAGTHSDRILKVPYLGRGVFAKSFIHFAVSNYTKQRLLKSGLRSECYYLPLGYSPFHYYKDRSIQRKHGQIICVGNDKPRKGVSYLIEAISLLPEILQRQISLIIVTGISNSYTHTNLSNLISSYRLQCQHTIYSNLSSHALRRLYNQSMVNVLLSQNVGDTYEGFGLTHIEAIASGCLTIGSINCGNESAIMPGNGYLLEQKCANHLSQLLEKLLSSSIPSPTGPQPLTWMQVTTEMIKYLKEIP